MLSNLILVSASGRLEEVTVHLDAMELAKGGQHPPGKREIAVRCHRILEVAGVAIRSHPKYERTDIVAENEDGRIYLVEVEGDSSRQPEQALYSALGQIILMMREESPQMCYALAVPDSPCWEQQLLKIPERVLSCLNLELMLVSASKVRPPDRGTDG